METLGEWLRAGAGLRVRSQWFDNPQDFLSQLFITQGSSPQTTRDKCSPSPSYSQRIWSSEYLCPRVQGLSKGKSDHLFLKNPAKVLSRASTLRLSPLLDLTLFSRSFSSVLVYANRPFKAAFVITGIFLFWSCFFCSLYSSEFRLSPGFCFSAIVKWDCDAAPGKWSEGDNPFRN